MSYKIIFSKKVFKFLEKCDKNILRKFNQAVDILQQNPLNNSLDIKKLVWSTNHYRLRIWKYRFIYELRNNKLLIYFYKADSRGNIYK